MFYLLTYRYYYYIIIIIITIIIVSGSSTSNSTNSNSSNTSSLFQYAYHWPYRRKGLTSTCVYMPVAKRGSSDSMLRINQTLT